MKMAVGELEVNSPFGMTEINEQILYSMLSPFLHLPYLLNISYVLGIVLATGIFFLYTN